MAFQIQNQYVDKALGQHIVHLHDEVTGAHHVLQIIVGHESCPVCGHVRVVDNAEELNPHELVRGEVANLEKAHAQSHAYARKHNIPVKQAK